MTVLQDFIKHLPLILEDVEGDADTRHIFCSTNETYEEWRDAYENWLKESPSYSPEDDFSERLLETIDGYSLYDLPEPNQMRLQTPNGSSYVINSVRLCEWW